MWNVKTEVVQVLIGAENVQATYLESVTQRNYIKQSYWALRTYFGKY